MDNQRGTSFGYNSLVVHYTGLDYMPHNLDADIYLMLTPVPKTRTWD